MSVERSKRMRLLGLGDGAEAGAMSIPPLGLGGGAAEAARERYMVACIGAAAYPMQATMYRSRAASAAPPPRPSGGMDIAPASAPSPSPSSRMRFDLSTDIEEDEVEALYEIAEAE